MLQSRSHHELDQTLYSVYLYRLLHRLCSSRCSRVDGTWFLARRSTICQTHRIIVTTIRGICLSDLRQLPPYESFARWCSVYRNWSWFCNCKNPILDLVLSICWSFDLPWFSFNHDAVVCNYDGLGAPFYLFLGFNARPHDLSFHLQPASICMARFLRRLQGVYPLDVSRQLSHARKLLDWVLPTLAYANHRIQTQTTGYTDG